MLRKTIKSVKIEIEKALEKIEDQQDYKLLAEMNGSKCAFKQFRKLRGYYAWVHRPLVRRRGSGRAASTAKGRRAA